MEIYIPTKGRRISDTLISLGNTGIEPTMVTDISDNNRLWSDIGWGRPIKQIQSPVHGIGPTRQWIIDQVKSDKVVMLDDDLVFATRREDDPTKFRPSSAQDITNLFRHIEACLDSYAHVGVSTREGGNRDVSSFITNTRLLRILAYRTDVLRAEQIRFDRLQLMEDFDVTLALLRRGYANIKINWIVHNQRSSNAPGGCSTYRTLEAQALAAKGLQEFHPDFVSVVTKKTKTAWNGQERQDVIIQWKRAFGADSTGTPTLLDTRAEPDNAQEGLGPTEAME